MVKFTIEQLRSIMDNQSNIRNMSVIAHVDHGKTTLCDSLVMEAGISKNTCYMDSGRADQMERGITIKSTGVSMYYALDLDGTGKQEYLINMIDSPGHIDFSSEVTAALRVTDGALVVVDAVKGVCVQTETVLRQAMQERIRPILMLNKIDRLLDTDPEEVYHQFCKVIEEVNSIIELYDTHEMGDIRLDPRKGNVAFGSGMNKWAFTLSTFARQFEKKLKVDANKLTNRLWGESYHHEGKWTTENVTQDGKPLTRSFVKFILEPIWMLARTIRDGNKDKIKGLLEKVELEVPEALFALDPKDLTKEIFSRWLKSADTLLEMIICHLPSPKVAQPYRTKYLYEGPQEDEIAFAMRNCDPKGPLVVFVSKMVPADGNRFLAFGRVFSGTVSTGQKVRILGSDYKPGTKEGVHEKSIQRTVIMMGKTVESIPDVPCGNTVALGWLDSYIHKTATLTDHPEAFPIRSMKYSVSPVVRVAVAPKNPADLPKLVQGLQRLSNSDPLIVCSTEETGELIVAGCGELHVEICLNDLENEYAGCPIKRSNPVVTYKETVTEQVHQPLLVKTQNKLNRVFATCMPLGQQLEKAIEKGEVGAEQDTKERSKKLIEGFEWDKNESMNIWCFGPQSTGANLLLDLTKGVQHMGEIKDHMCNSFQSFTRHGALIEEELRGLRVNIVDCMVHPDGPHHGGGQFLPAARRLYSGLELAAQPTLYEPVYYCEIAAPASVLGGVFQVVNQRRGEVISSEQVSADQHVVKVYLPIAESFGLTESLRERCQGKAFPQCSFDHWSMLRDLPQQPGSKAEDLVRQIRTRKGLKA
jgi:elongation factor 2